MCCNRFAETVIITEVRNRLIGCNWFAETDRITELRNRLMCCDRFAEADRPTKVRNRLISCDRFAEKDRITEVRNRLAKWDFPSHFPLVKKQRSKGEPQFKCEGRHKWTANSCYSSLLLKYLVKHGTRLDIWQLLSMYVSSENRKVTSRDDPGPPSVYSTPIKRVDSVPSID